ncbi:MAG: DNA-3-methyladenine glycosylase 2 family protein [Actinomycetota bacterium]
MTDSPDPDLTERAGGHRREVVTGEIDLDATLRHLALLPSDPTVSFRPGRLERATITPAGPATVLVRWDAAEDRVELTTWGPGGDWIADRASGLLGLEDDVGDFDPPDRPLRDVWRRNPGRRIARTDTLWHDLAWFIVQQRVRTTDADHQWRLLVESLGTPADGPSGLLVPPAPSAVARLHYTEFHRFGIERRRADVLQAAARLVDRLAETVDGPFDAADPKLATVRGIGPWTRSCLAVQTWGEADVVIVGDDGIPSVVSWFLAREATADDARMIELLEPHRPHRYRVIQLAFASGARPPRRHHRYARNDIRRR